MAAQVLTVISQTFGVDFVLLFFNDPLAAQCEFSGPRRNAVSAMCHCASRIRLEGKL
jgi:hypothetical protein